MTFTDYLLDQFRDPRLTEAEARELALVYAQRRAAGVLTPERYQEVIKELRDPVIAV